MFTYWYVTMFKLWSVAMLHVYLLSLVGLFWYVSRTMRWVAAAAALRLQLPAGYTEGAGTRVVGINMYNTVPTGNRSPMLLNDERIFTAHKRSCGKVMFSQVSVCHSVQGVHMWPLPMMHWDLTFPDTRHGGTYLPLLTSGGHHWIPVQTCTLEDLSTPQPVLTSSCGHRKRTVRILLECCLFVRLYA